MVSRGESVLVVEDDESLAQVLALALCAEGFEARTARDGIHGYNCYSHHPTDWVVTDIQMPQLDGIGMMQCIRAINPKVRTVYMSGAVDEYWGPLERETKEFAAKVLRKPFSRSHLIEQLSTEPNAGPPGAPEKVRERQEEV
jgi:two-component system response regulator ChvI